MSRECKSIVNLLGKARVCLESKITITGKPIILANINQYERLRRAKGKIDEAIDLIDFDTQNDTQQRTK